MKLLVISQSRNRAGKPIQAKKEINADWVRVGRAANSEIHLPDPRIALNQGIIVNRDGPVYTEGEAGSMSTTRKAVRSFRLGPGQFVDVGPYKLTAIETPEGYDGAFTVEMMRPPETVASNFSTRATTLSLSQLHIPKRWAAILFFLAIGIAFFLLPAGRVLDLPWKQASASTTVVGDRIWNPGQVMLAHQPIEMKCESCHQVAFQQVRDRACLECHSKIGQHVGPEFKPVALFDGARCATCHKDHKGVKSTHRDDDLMCVACHKEVRAKANGAQAQNVSDFTKDHPAFRLSIPSVNGIKRVRMGSGVIEEKSNIIFPHDVHLNPKGIRSPTKERVVLDCGNCHAPDASKRTFEPIRMAKNCQECHALEFEPAVTTRQVPHGKPAEAITVVNEFYANLSLNGVKDSFEKAFGVPGEGLLRRVGQPNEAERRVALALASKKAKQVSEELFEIRVCKTCHELIRTGEGDAKEWNVLEVRANNAWMPSARFDHKSHLSSKCADCHNVAKSSKSSDVAMPTIESCRNCHGGSRPVEKKVTSNCLMCHGFHEAKHPWDPDFKPHDKAHVALESRVAH